MSFTPGALELLIVGGFAVCFLVVPAIVVVAIIVAMKRPNEKGEALRERREK